MNAETRKRFHYISEQRITALINLANYEIPRNLSSMHDCLLNLWSDKNRLFIRIYAYITIFVSMRVSEQAGRYIYAGASTYIKLLRTKT